MAGSDFSIDFAAAAPQIYDHDTGGGAFEDKTINVDAVESLEGGDFAVGDIVSYYFNVNVKPDAVDQFAQTIEIDVSFLVNTTGQTGVSHRDIVGVSANYWTGELDSGGNATILEDTALDDDESTTAWIVPGTKIYENKVSGVVYPDYDTAANNQGAVVSATVRLNDLEPGEEIVLRVDTLLDALAGSTPTGNLQGFVTGARVISPTDDPVINVGNQTIPFKLTDEISGIPELAPGLTVEKVVTSDLSGLDVNYATHTTNQEYEADTYYESVENESVTVLEGSDVRFLYKITNTGNATTSLVNLIDDNGTPSNTADDIFLFYSDNGSDIVWNHTVNINNQGKKSPGNPVTNPNGIFNILGTGFIDDSDPNSPPDDPDQILDNLKDLDTQGNDTDPKSLEPGDSIYVYYDVTINDTNRTAIESSTNIATVEGAVDPNGGGQQGDSVSDTDTANIQILPSAATTATLSGYSYLDLNNNGDFEAGESGIVGITIELLDSDGDSIDSDPIKPDIQPTTTLTDLNGFYIFTDIAPGTYIIKQTQPSYYYDGQETPGTNNGGAGGGGTGSDTPTPSRISSIDIQAGNYYSDYNFGELLPADVSGVAYIDLNNDGNRQDTETGRAGIQVTLSGTDDLGNMVNLSTTTDSSGRYYFGSLRPSGGTGYTITFTGDGDVSDPGDIGQILGTDVGTAGTDQITNITLAAGDSGVNYDFGVNPDTIGGTISGTVYQDTGIYEVNGVLTGADNGSINDTNANSFSTTPSTGEKRIAGVTIELYDSSNTLFATTKTDINGNYSFTGLAADTYYVVETQPQYYDPSANNGEGDFVNYLDGQDARDNAPITENNDTITGLTIDNFNNNLIGNNFGELPPASISGYVFLDLLRTKQFGLAPNESLTNSDDSSTLTDINGSSVSVGGNQFTNFSVPVRNGEFDDDEFGIAGVTVRLYNSNDLNNSIDEQITDANGYYRFDALSPGDYTVIQVQPSDYVDGIYNAQQKTNPDPSDPVYASNLVFSASDVNSGNVLGTSNGQYIDGQSDNSDIYTDDNFNSIVLNYGQSGVEYNFPEATSSGLITGTVYADVDNDNFGDSPLSGVTIELLQGGVPIATTTTNSNGYYAFTNVAVGDYQIRQTDLGGYESVKDEDSIPDGTNDGDDNTANTNDNLLPVNIANTTPGEIDSGNDFIDRQKNTITGTGKSETLTGTAGNDVLIGGAGQDTLTGNAGNDCFKFNRTSDGIDIITDFMNGDNKIDLSSFFATGGELEGITNPFGNPNDSDNYVEALPIGTSGTLIQIDFDPTDGLPNKNVVYLQGYDTSTTAMTAADFIF